MRLLVSHGGYGWMDRWLFGHEIESGALHIKPHARGNVGFIRPEGGNKGPTHNNLVLHSLQSTSVTLTPLGIWKGVSVSNRLLTASLYLKNCNIRKVNLGFEKCHSKQ